MKTSSKIQNKKTKISFTIFFIALITMFSVGCTPTPTPTPSCSTTNTLFQQLYNSVVAMPGDTNKVTMDVPVHGYNFTVSATKTICSIGYQSQPAVASQPYNIEIIDSTAGTTLYSINAVFSSTATSYVSVPNVVVVPGHTYYVRRTLQNYGGLFSNTIGRLATSSTYHLTFPFTAGVLTITSAYFSTSTPNTNYGLPFIDIVFQ